MEGEEKESLRIEREGFCLLNVLLRRKRPNFMRRPSLFVFFFFIIKIE